MIMNCPECGALVEAREATVGLHHVVPGFQVRRGPVHERRCPHWRRDRPEDR